MTNKPERYPSWCTIDAYDDLGARSSKRHLQSLYDSNQSCIVCFKGFREHVTEQGTPKQDHLFNDSLTLKERGLR